MVDDLVVVQRQVSAGPVEQKVELGLVERTKMDKASAEVVTRWTEEAAEVKVAMVLGEKPLRWDGWVTGIRRWRSRRRKAVFINTAGMKTVRVHPVPQESVGALKRKAQHRME